MSNKKYIEVGKILKAHSLKGDLKVSFEASFLAFAKADLKVVFLKQQGSYLPYFIERLEQKGDSCLLRLEEIDDRDKASALSGLKLYCDSEIVPMLPKESPEDPIKAFNGYALRDLTSQMTGEIVEIQETAGQILALISFEANREDAFLPLHSDLILEVDHEQKLIVCQLPIGIFDL